MEEEGVHEIVCWGEYTMPACSKCTCGKVQAVVAACANRISAIEEELRRLKEQWTTKNEGIGDMFRVVDDELDVVTDNIDHLRHKVTQLERSFL